MAKRTILSLFVAFVAFQARAEVTNVTGAITGTTNVYKVSAGMISIQLQGTNFALNGTISDYAWLGARSFVFDPTLSVRNVVPLPSGGWPIGCCPTSGASSAQLIYNGTTYNNLQIVLNATGTPATVTPAMVDDQCNDLSGSVSGQPFSLSGVVSAFAAPPDPVTKTFSGPALLSVSFSGSGTYRAGEITGPCYGWGYLSNITYQFLPTPTGFNTDAATQGSWTGNYGGEGYWIANGASSLPSYAAMNFERGFTYSWAPQTSDLTALQNGPGARARIASAYTDYYGQNFDIDINFTDQNAHRVALYLLDFDSINARVETITVTNSDTGAFIDTETISNFHNGIWASWGLRGNVKISVKCAGGAPVVSGIFFGPGTRLLPPLASDSAAYFLGSDPYTKGNWIGAYGRAGYQIPNGPGSAPVTASLMLGPTAPYTWVQSTTDPRAMQIPPAGSTGVASAYTEDAGSSFAFSVFAAPKTVALVEVYVLDWDNLGRSETITITDQSTGAVIDTRTVSGFQGGVYLSWQVAGNVTFTVTPNGWYSPVVSGILFN